MAKFYGAIGYNDGTVETSPGVYEEQIVEKIYMGDVVRGTRNLIETDGRVNDNITLDNSISIVADAYASEHIFAMRYIRWQGALWKIENIQVERPRLLLRLGGVYNGPTA